MKQIIIQGGNKLSGTIKISGAKNSAVALIPASILADDVVKIDNVPNISDIEALNEILEFLGAKVTMEDGLMTIDPKPIKNKNIPGEYTVLADVTMDDGNIVTIGMDYNSLTPFLL